MSSSSTESAEQILDRFEDSWNGPTPPRIEDYLALVEPPQRLALLIELIRIDRERRRKAGERIGVKEAYLQRWPQYRKELSELFHAEATLPSASAETLAPPSPQPTEEAGDVIAFLSPPHAPGEIGRLGSYRLLKVLGAGGMGVVFLAEDTRLKRLVALKVMRPGIAVNAMARQRFLREAQAMAALKNERIIPIYQVEEERGVPYLAMEYLQGETLHERLRREATPPMAEVLSIALDIASGLVAAHERGLIHRDIKPANIWLESPPSGNGPARVKLLDFGLTRPAGDDAAHLTQTGVIVGTPAYMSPEQARGESLDTRSDLFSLGCVLYRMITGQLPFKGRDAVSTLLSLTQEQPKPPCALKPGIPPTLNRLIVRLLAKNLPDRPSSAAAVVAALQSIADEWCRPLPAVAIAPPSPKRTPPRRRFVVAGLLLLGLTALLAGIVIRIRGKDGRVTTIEVPEGSKVTIEREGKIAVIPAETPAAAPPLIEGTEPLGSFALVQRPARLKGVRSWTIETLNPRRHAVSLALRPDGRQLAVGSFDGVIRLYDPNTGQLQKILFGEAKRLITEKGLTWSPDGKRLASVYGDGTLHIWDAVTAQILRTLHFSEGAGSVAWSPDGKLLATGTDQGVSLWDAESGKLVAKPLSARGIIYSLAWSPDSKILAAGSNSPEIVRLCELPSGKLLHTFDGFKGTMKTLAWSPDGQTLAAAARGEKVCRIWDAHSGKLLRTLELIRLQGDAAAYSPDGKILALGTQEWGIIDLYETETGKQVGWLPGNGFMTALFDLAWSPDGTTIIGCGKQINIFDVKTRQIVRRIEPHIVGNQFSLSWSTDGKKIASSHSEGIRIWDADSGTQLHRIADVGGALAWSSQGALAPHRGNLISICDGERGQLRRSWNIVPSYISPAWSPDGKRIATAAEKNVQVWAAASGRLIHMLRGHTANISAIAWSPDGQTIASGSEDKTVRLWDASSGKQMHSFDADACIRLAWSLDGKSLAAGTGGDTRIWDIASNELQTRCSENFVGWSADSAAFLTRKNNLVHCWNRQTGDLIRETKSGPLLDNSLGSSDGRFAASDGRTCLDIWETASGRLALTLVPLRAGQWLSLRPDGHYRGSPGVEKEIIYVVRTDAGQELLTPAAFEKKYGWKNDPSRVRLPPRETVP